MNKRHVTLDEWDREMRPFLSIIKSRAAWIASDARQIASWVRSLPATPDFETLARDQLAKTKKELVDAIWEIDAAITEYDKKEKVT